ncbi:GGDEF domain-containing protein [Neobacillus sp. OS1-2]|uniref:sensor domain-containing diguanylate cyclase n=1 Tax=Neobacillus sp. OS1-2 TaxID=3070680 RepID=UPI0027DF4B1A|nr:GGDEF domain-containing protein [Neobacillus sp. OS1-2]WML41297.1 GGDEF domain-containing protein [Neobacillus sp. OS1-2]
MRSIRNHSVNQEFNQSNYEQLYERMKLISYMLIFTYPCFFIVDFVLFKNLDAPVFKIGLASVHITGLMISIIFLMIYRLDNQKVSKSLVVNGFILFYLLMGAVSAINSQLFTGNIYAYIIILLAVAAILPIRPRNLLIQFVTVHGGFLIGLFFIHPNHYSYLSMLINSTGTVVISFTIALAFYSFRKNDFLNQARLNQSEESFRRLFTVNPNPLILAKSASGEIVLLNQQAIEYYHLDPHRTESFEIQYLFRTLDEQQEILKRLEAEKSIRNYLTEQQITPELKKWSLLNFELVEYMGDTCMLIDTTDITDLKKKEAELLEHASIDMLTGVRNRRCGIELLRELQSAGPRQTEFILCYIDINNLKIVNDRYGHSTGDDLIKTCCETINLHLEPQDVLFRLGGDEFIIIFLKKQLADAEKAWDHIKLAFQAINDSKQKPYQISASHGYYHYKPDVPITLEEMLELADQDMYKNKVNYKGQKSELMRR